MLKVDDKIICRDIHGQEYVILNIDEIHDNGYVWSGNRGIPSRHYRAFIPNPKPRYKYVGIRTTSRFYKGVEISGEHIIVQWMHIYDTLWHLKMWVLVGSDMYNHFENGGLTKEIQL